MIKVNANLFRIVNATVSTEETRYYLNGVCIEPHEAGGALMVATDGHRLLAAHDPKGECAETAIVKLPRFVLAQCKTPKMFAAERVLEIDPSGNGAATLVEITPGLKDTDEPKREPIVTAHGVSIDGTFPDWRRAVPREECQPDRSAPTAFNPRYMKAWGEIGLELAKTNGGDSALHFAISTGHDPIVVRFGSSPNVFGIQMPLRHGILGYLPKFMDKPEFQQAAE